MTTNTPLSPRVQRTRQRILQAAAENFGKFGYSGATTRGIAETAGVSELTLFRHFGSKKNLFLETVQKNSPGAEMAARFSEGLSGDLRKDLTQIGNAFLNTLIQRRLQILTTLQEAERLPEVRQVGAQIQSAQRRLLAEYLTRQIEAGVLRPLAVEMMAQSFLGMLFAYAINLSFEAPTGGPDPAALRRTLDLFVDIFLQGILPSKE